MPEWKRKWRKLVLAEAKRLKTKRAHKGDRKHAEYCRKLIELQNEARTEAQLLDDDSDDSTSEAQLLDDDSDDDSEAQLLDDDSDDDSEAQLLDDDSETDTSSNAKA